MAIFIFCALLLAVQAAVLLPSADPFYQPPPGFAASLPGSVLKYRPVNASSVGTTNITAYQLLYRSRGVNGGAIATVTTVLVPFNAAKDKFVSFQVAEDSASFDCAPSYNIQDGATANNVPANMENSKIDTYLSTGVIVAVPDHEGPDAAFPAGRLAGYLVLDGMRAVSSWMGTSPQIAGASYSGGSIATGWAASLHPVYASELPVKAWTMGGSPVDLSSTMRAIDRGFFAGFQTAALVGLNKPSSYQALLQPLYSKIMTAYGQAQLSSAASSCVGTDIVAFGGQSVLDYRFQTLGPSILQHKDVAYILAQNTMGTNKSETPRAPVLLYHATADQIIPYASVSTLNKNWCANGASVHFTTYTNGGHFSAEGAGIVPAVKFASAAFAGQLAGGCATESISNLTIDANSLGLQSVDALLTVISDTTRVGEP